MAKTGDIVLFRDAHSGRTNPFTGLPEKEDHPVCVAIVKAAETTKDGDFLDLHVLHPNGTIYPGRVKAEPGTPGELGRYWPRE